ncbi:unnamed protein product [Rhizoctonia solani]|uniref:FAD-binding domain-containing protein n=1 Tax=Rhizoctonia solani TaxID=456999 RepID=A0A8H3DXW6_9AGAM|nr:unnamed protein product [Rhizoctonia solani]
MTAGESLEFSIFLQLISVFCSWRTSIQTFSSTSIQELPDRMLANSAPKIWGAGGPKVPGNSGPFDSGPASRLRSAIQAKTVESYSNSSELEPIDITYNPRNRRVVLMMFRTRLDPTCCRKRCGLAHASPTFFNPNSNLTLYSNTYTNPKATLTSELLLEIMSAPRIAIIGAGPGGLTLACILLRHSIVPTVFERDPSPDFRPQGGTLDLHVHSGQEALRQAGLFDEFLKHARYDGQATRFLTKTAEIVHEPRHGDSAETARPEIDRTALRDMLLESFGSDNVHWGHSLASVEPAAKNKYDLHFKDGKIESGFDLVVGADGAWSRVRPLLTSAIPFFSGIAVLEFHIQDPSGSRYDTVNELVRRGSAFGFGDQKAIIGQRLGTNAIRIYAGFAMDGLQADWLDTQFDEKDPQGTKDKALAFFEGWSPDLLDLIRLADDSVLFRSLHMLPVDLTWEPRTGLTLLGDAAHLMTPFAGEGVNMTMWDSLELGKRIIEGVQTGDINQAIREYEVGLFERGGNSMKKTDRQKQAFFSKNYPESVQEIIQRLRAGRGVRH